MGVRILSDGRDDKACMYCSTSGWAFGPVFRADDEHDAEERAEAFVDWLGKLDPRSFTDNQLEAKLAEWNDYEEEYWKEKEKTGDYPV